jgi:hypothetical protein
MSWGKQTHLNPKIFGNFEHMTSKIIFQKIHLSDIVLGAARQHIPENF